MSPLTTAAPPGPAAALLAHGRGLLAPDHGLDGVLRAAGLDPTPARRAGLAALVTGTPGLGRVLGGVLLDGTRGARMVVGEHAGTADLVGAATRCAAAADHHRRAGRVPVVECRVVPPPGRGLDVDRHTAAFTALADALAGQGFGPGDIWLVTTFVLPPGRAVAAPADVAAATALALRPLGALPAGVALRAGADQPGYPAHLAALGHHGTAWPIGFCVGGSVLAPVVRAWRGNPHRVTAARRLLWERLAHLRAVVRSARAA